MLLKIVRFLTAIVAFLGMSMFFLIMLDGHITLTRMGLLPSTIQYPISSPQSIAVDHEGNIYLDLTPYDRIQKYDKDGNYVMGWFLPPKEGNFYIGIFDDDHIHVITQTSKHLIYSLDGELISDVAIDSSEEYHHLVKRYSCLETTDNAGILYKIVSRIWHPTILKCPSIATNQILVKDEYWRWSLGIPFPSLVYSCIAMLLCILFEKLQRDKTKKADNFEVN